MTWCGNSSVAADALTCCCLLRFIGDSHLAACKLLATDLTACDCVNRFVEGDELIKLSYKLRRDWDVAQGEEERQKAHKCWLDAVREGMHQMMQVCIELMADVQPVPKSPLVSLDNMHHVPIQVCQSL